MNITGTWKVTEVCVFGEDFSQSWRTAESVASDESVHPMQRAFAQSAWQPVWESPMTMIMSSPKGQSGKRKTASFLSPPKLTAATIGRRPFPPGQAMKCSAISALQDKPIIQIGT